MSCTLRDCVNRKVTLHTVARCSQLIYWHYRDLIAQREHLFVKVFPALRSQIASSVNAQGKDSSIF